MAKHYMVGSGLPGCLFDHTTGPFETQSDAAEYLIDFFDEDSSEGGLSERDAHEFRTALRSGDTSYYFKGEARTAAGAGYCEIWECDCDGSEHESED